MDLGRTVGRLLPALDATFPSGLLATLRGVLGEAVGAAEVGVYLADYDHEFLCELTEQPHDAGRTLPVDVGPLGAAFIGQRAIVIPVDGGRSAVYVPLSSRGERLGVLCLTTAVAPDDVLLGQLVELGTVLAHVVPRMALYSDQVERTRRVVPLTLPAEIQWSELPIRAYSCDRFDVAGQLCPAYEVGGDLFDYTLQGEHLQVSALDAMGHGLGASMLGSLAINALRNNRRAGLPLVDQVRGADRVLYGQHGGEKFVCGAFLRLDTATGEVDVVNAGHPVGALVRAGRVSLLDVPAQLPMGLFERTVYEQHRLQLQRGDRLVLVSDGVLEAAPPGGEEYGEDRLAADLLALQDETADETVRRLVGRLRGYEGSDLRDDITVVVLDWRGPASPAARDERPW